MDGVFISEELGIEKLSEGFFDRVFEKIGVFAGAEVLIVGDSLASDIQGGNNAGIQTCLFNPDRKVEETDLRIDYEIADLKEILDIVKKG